MKKATKIFLVGLLIAGFSSCEKENNSIPEKIETIASRTGDTSILMQGKVSGNGNMNVKEIGFVYSSASEIPTGTDSKVECTTTDFSFLVTGLDYSKDYWIRAYAIYNVSDTVWGNIVKVSGIEKEFSVTTEEDIIYNKDGTVEVKGKSDVEYLTVRGFLYAKDVEEPTYENAEKIIVNSSLFEAKITGLSIDVDYFIRAFAVFNKTDTVYGNVVTAKILFNDPELSTLPVINITQMAAIVCGQFKELGDLPIESYGLCLSSDIEPDIQSDIVLEAPDYDKQDRVGLFGVFFDYLEPETNYFVRSYAITQKGVVYGDVQNFKTKADDGSNRINWSWSGGVDLAKQKGSYDRITEAMDSAMIYYRKYSNLTHHINVSYNEGVATADCNILGSMRFGANSRYQWVGTAQHEISHAMGVGQAWNWRNLIQSDSGIRQWKGEEAVITLRVMMKDMTQVLKGDAQHFWPGGINQREEVTNGQTNSYGVIIKDADMLKCNAMILNAMRIDGLATSW